MEKIKKTKNNIDYLTYVSIGAVVATLISICIFTRMSQTTRVISILVMIIFSAISLLGQISKENRVKKLIDGYISVIKTDWYAQSLTREYVYLCNYTG
jgi:c-di-AMP phosphodiesterase-like protein